MKVYLAPLPSFGSIFFVLIFVILLAKSGSLLLADGDTGYHIRTGEVIIQNGAIPTQDIFSYLKPAPKWVAHEWLSEVFMAIIYRIAGLSGIIIFFAAFLALIHVFLYHSLRDTCNDVVLVIAITAIAVITSSTHWFARPHVFSMALTLAWYDSLNKYQSDQQNTLKYLPALMLFWANLHAGFIIGLILLSIYALGNLLAAMAAFPSLREKHYRKTKTLAAFAVLCGIAACVNPHGYEILLFPFKLTSDRLLMDRVAEFLSPDFHKALPFKYMLLSLVAVACFSRLRLDYIEVGLIILLTYMSLYSVRYVSLFAIIVSRPLLKISAHVLGQMPPPILRFYEQRVRNVAALERYMDRVLWPGIALCLTAAVAGAGSLHFEFSTTRFPVEAVNFLKREAVPGNIFNHDEFGDYMIFAAWPQYRVFIDGRSDMYGADHVSDYLKVADGQPDWDNIMGKYNITMVFFSPRSPIATILRGRQDWSTIYSDDVASIFVRNAPQYRLLINKYKHLAANQ